MSRSSERDRVARLLGPFGRARTKKPEPPQVPPTPCPNPTTQADPGSSNSNSQERFEKRTHELVWSGLKAFLGVVQASADAFGPLKSATEGLSRCIELFEEASKREKEFEELGEKLDQLLGDLAPFANNLARMGPAMTSSVKNLCTAIQAELKSIEEQHSRKALKRRIGMAEDLDDLLGCYRRIHGHVARLKVSSITQWQYQITRLRQLSPTTDGLYNSKAADSLKRGLCTEGTRELELRKLVNWARDPSGAAIYWLNGMAGTGKTTIAYSLCAELDATGELAASFFCSRSIPECRNVHLIIPAIAYQLAQFSYPFKFALLGALRLSPDAHTLRLGLQFDKLIVGPLEEVRQALPSDFVVVIDALEECQDVSVVREILELLTHESSMRKLPVRFLVSSRPEPEIYEYVNKTTGKNSNAGLILHELDESAVNSDIEKYLRCELRDIPLSISQWAGLVERCGALFIYASTAARYIKAGYKYKKWEQCVSTLLDLSANPAGAMEALDLLYATILHTAFEGNTELDKQDKELMKLIIHTVISVQEPVTTDVLASLIRLDDSEQVDAMLHPLRSVLHVTDETKTVAVLHASFPEFMINRVRAGPQYWCDAAIYHKYLTFVCLQRIESNPVQFNICGIKSSYLLDSEITELRVTERINAAIPPDLNYACRYWGDHLDLSGQLQYAQEILYDFLTTRLLLWMEVLSVKHSLKKGTRMLKRVEELCRRAGAPKHIFDIASDAVQFVSNYANHPVSESTAHLYMSMIPFWPCSSPLAKYYVERTSGIPWPVGDTITKRKSALLATSYIGNDLKCVLYFSDGSRIAVAAGHDIYIMDGWSGQVIIGPVGHGGPISSLAASLNGSMLASGSDDKTVWLWDTTTGESTAGPLQGHEGSVTSVEFSHNGTRILSVGRSIRVWSTQTGECIFSIGNEFSLYKNAYYSRDRSRIISFSLKLGPWDTVDTAISFWDVETGRSVQKQLDLELPPPRTFSCSSGDLHVISANRDYELLVWRVDAEQQQLLNILKGHTGRVNTAIFSPNNLYIASGGDDTTIRVWDIFSRKTVIDPLEGHIGSVCSVSFSPDGARLVSSSNDGTVRIWNINLVHTTTGLSKSHTNRISSLRFSSDSSLLVSGEYDGDICIWDSYTGKLVLGPLSGHTKPVYSVDISSGRSYVASASDDKTMRLWNIKDGGCICKILETDLRKPGWVRFSPDGFHLVFGSDDANCHVYRLFGDPFGVLCTTGSFSEVVGLCDFQMLGCQAVFRNEYTSVFYNLPEGMQRIVRFNDSARETRLSVSGTSRCEPDSLMWYTGGLYSISLSPDCLYAVSGFDHGAIQFWDVRNGLQLNMAALEGHTQSVRLVQFSPDGSRIVSCSNDNTLRLWTVPSKKELNKWKPAHTYQSLAHSTNVNSTPSRPASQYWTINKDGWVTDLQCRHIIWVPPELRVYLLRPRNDVLISAKGSFKLDFEGSSLGELWIGCYKPATPVDRISPILPR
ncbi:Vegetative incompatibility protein HET-E-1 [Ceratobasidium sp. AG-Ba]|nr:Vegetative incompatibility protein HET-E-1 [Ceratobasidium sp. AG-Ba]